MLILDATGSAELYRGWLNELGDRTWTLEALAGLRYSSLGGELQFQPVGPVTLPAVQQSKNWIDPIVGFRLSADLTENLTGSLRGDIGGFGVGSDVTWQAAALIAYRFSMFGKRAEAGVGYRALHWNFSDGTGPQQFKWDATLQGPLIGLLVHL